MGCFAAAFEDEGLAAFEGGLVDVAEGDDFALGDLEVFVHVIAPAAAESDDSHGDAIVGSPDARGGESGAGSEYEMTPIH